ncbi:mitochondrial carrier protein [Cryptosporidium ubiquitum]|uniref:Mitochondrial carrier protein n=1 Tax=Cryptosporidium ubiquitum TaxID=857276 RepID=A0A1J4MGC6_9CRYT|nr:mitochondrial carrier protein [Cryptosporidium ubiquitum]OII73286.1 mitochondrial carrier protein [Cryptosporidium ubiquitum]
MRSKTSIEEDNKAEKYHGLKSPIGLTFLNGLAVSFACTPLDVIKNYWVYRNSNEIFNRELCADNDVRLHQAPSNINTLKIIRELYRHRGMRTFWTGLFPTMMFNIPSNIIFFNTYYYFLNAMGFSPGIAGIQARTITTLFVCPMEFVRTRIQAQIGNELFLNLNGVGAKVYRRNAPLLDSIRCINVYQLWSGLWITILRDVPFTAVYWTLTEKLRIILQRKMDSGPKKTIKLFSIAAFSGTVATLVSHPLDIIKTNIQTHSFNHNLLGKDPISARRIVSSLFQRRGLKNFYTGVFPRILKIVPSCAISLALFELCRK